MSAPTAAPPPRRTDDVVWPAPPARLASRRARAFAAIVVAVLLVATALNVIAFARAQDLALRGYALARGPRDVVAQADLNRHPVVRGQIALYHHLRQSIAGARLTIPPWLEDRRWWLERVARLDVRVSPTSLYLDVERRFELRREAPMRRDYLRSRQPRRYQRLNLGLAGPDVAYVLAQLEAGGELFLIPEARYREVAVPPPTGPGAIE